jgi:endonuclease III
MAQKKSTSSPPKKPTQKAVLPKANTPKANLLKAKSKPAAAAPRRGRPAKSLSPEAIATIFTRFAQAEPEPKGELNYVNTYTLLVAVVLSAQSTDAGVNRATHKLFALADTPAKMLALGEEKVRNHIKTIGLYRTKAKNVIALSRALINDHAGEVPATREALESLPGVGRKTANVVLNIAFGEPTMAVDTHLFRLANRIPLARGSTPLAVENGLLKVIPARFLTHAHHWLILHGRYICKARAPACGRCLINDLCTFKDKTL